MEQTKKISWEVLVFILSFAFLLSFRLALAKNIQKSSGSPQSNIVQSSSPIIPSSGGYHTCAQILNGVVICWGKNVMGQLGHGTDVEEMGVPVPLTQLGGTAVSVAAGRNHSCSVLDTGQVMCWGYNDAGQLGTGNMTDKNTPKTVLDLNGSAITVTTGVSHSCALLEDGLAKCWGDNAHGQLGNGTNVDSLTPVDVLLSGSAIVLEAGDYHTCAIMTEGGITCWGRNSSGQLGNNSNESSTTPQEVYKMSHKTVTAIVAGSSHTCVVLEGSDVACWGENSHGQLGNGEIEDSKVPQSVSALTNDTVVNVAAGRSHTCVVLNSGEVKCWGSNYSGQLGDNSNDNSTTPVNVEGINNAVMASAGDYHTCASLSSGSLKCWGRNSESQLGDNSQSNSETPVTVYGF